MPLPNLTESELGKFFIILHYYLRINNKLQSETDRSFTVDKVKNILKLKESQAYNFIKKLNDLGVIKYHTHNELLVNPIYMLKGELDSFLYEYFKNDIDNSFKNIPKELKRLWELEILERQNINNNYHIYKFINSSNEVIYIGRSKDIIKRLNHQHFTPNGHLSQECYNEVKEVYISPLEDEVAMSIYEKYYISKYKPKYNVQYKNDKVLTFELPEVKWELYKLKGSELPSE